MTRVFRVARTMKIMDQRRLSKTTRQYGTLILSVLALVFIAAGIVQLVEASALLFLCVGMWGVGC